MIAGINGDFYKAGGVPVHSQIIDGEILKLPVQRDAIAMDEEQRIYLGSFSYSGQLETFDPSTVLTIDGLTWLERQISSSYITNIMGIQPTLMPMDMKLF